MKSIASTSLVESVAVKSQCGSHRFVLSRVWDRKRPVNAFLCANPSKADDLKYDATVFKCGNMAVNWGWGGFHVLNVHSFYATDPARVKHDPLADSLNEEHVLRVLREVSLVVLACGNGHEKALEKLIRQVPRNKLYCLGRNKGGGFLHPSRQEPDNFKYPIPAYPAEA